MWPNKTNTNIKIGFSCKLDYIRLLMQTADFSKILSKDNILNIMWIANPPPNPQRQIYQSAWEHKKHSKLLFWISKCWSALLILYQLQAFLNERMEHLRHLHLLFLFLFFSFNKTKSWSKVWNTYSLIFVIAISNSWQVCCLNVHFKVTVTTF